MTKWLPEGVTKIGYTIPVSAELLREYAPPTAPTDEERESAREWAIREHNDAVNRHAAALNRANGVARAVLELHAPTFDGNPDPSPMCNGCDFTGYEADPPFWPCRTYELVEKWETA